MRAVVLLLIASLVAAAPRAAAQGSYLYQPAYAIDRYLRLPAEPYCAQPGDLFFAYTEDFIMRWGHRIAGAADPHHSGIVFARPDGSLAVLEAGPFNMLVVTGMDLLDHLNAYAKTERCWIRKRRVPLTAEQSRRLTEFCLAQVGKRFAAFRVLAQITPFRSRGPWTEHCGKPSGDRPRWFCAELVCEALVQIGELDAATARPAATYPRDLFFDCSPNHWLSRHLNLSGRWRPPALWAATPYGAAGAPAVRRVYRSSFD